MNLLKAVGFVGCGQKVTSRIFVLFTITHAWETICLKYATSDYVKKNLERLRKS